MRNWIKKCSAILAAALVLSLVVPAIVPAAGVIKAEAAEVKLSDKKVKLEVGETHQLELEGTESNAKWKSKKSKVASVDKNGVITAKKEGKTTIIATVDGQKYKCKVTVVRAENPYVAEAPFEAEEYCWEDTKTSIAMPKGWIAAGYDVLGFIWPSEEANSSLSTITMLDKSITKAVITDEMMEMLKAEMEATYTEEMLQEELMIMLEEAGVSATVTVDENGMVIGEVETLSQDCRMLEMNCRLICEAEGETMPIEYTFYIALKEGVIHIVQATDMCDYEGEIALKDAAKYIAESITLH